jgi:hypothetical protein
MELSEETFSLSFCCIFREKALRWWRFLNFGKKICATAIAEVFPLFICLKLELSRGAWK